MKKLNKFVAVLVALAMMSMLAVVTAFADDPVGTDGFSVTKNLTISNDLDIDDVEGTVTITIAPTKVNGNADTTTASTVTKTIDFATDDSVENDTITNSNATTYAFTTGSITPADLGLTNADAGLYEFEIKEASADVKANSGNKEVYDEDDNESFTLIVRKDKDGNYYYTAADENGEKVTVKNGTDVTTDATDVKTNGLQFTNTLFDSRESEEDDHSDSAFIVSKTVVDTANVYTDGTTFTFKMSVKIPDMADADDVEAVKVNGNGEETFTPDNYTGTEFTVNLADGDAIYFTKVPAGTVITVYEDDANASTTEKTKLYFTEGTQYTSETMITKDNQLNAAVKNTSQETTLEGIMTTNLPYIVLALVAIGGMVAYVVVRRKADNEA